MSVIGWYIKFLCRYRCVHMTSYQYLTSAWRKGDLSKQTIFFIVKYWWISWNINYINVVTIKCKLWRKIKQQSTFFLTLLCLDIWIRIWLLSYSASVDTYADEKTDWRQQNKRQNPGYPDNNPKKKTKLIKNLKKQNKTKWIKNILQTEK